MQCLIRLYTFSTESQVKQATLAGQTLDKYLQSGHTNSTIDKKLTEETWNDVNIANAIYDQWTNKAILWGKYLYCL